MLLPTIYQRYGISLGIIYTLTVECAAGIDNIQLRKKIIEQENSVFMAKYNVFQGAVKHTLTKL